MRFIVNGMLGSSSRWLRILGCDVKYYNKVSDDELLGIAKKESRILLTKDLELFRRAKSFGLEVFFVEGLKEAERLANISRRFNIKLEVNTLISRCPSCNFHIKSVLKKEVLNKVPSGTLKHYEMFWVCTGCGKVYWRGSHWKNINTTLAKAKKIMSEIK